MPPEIVGLLGIAALVALLLLRVQVGLAMLAVSTAGYAVIVSPAAGLTRLGGDLYRSAASFSLSVVPLFILMGFVLAQSDVGADLFRSLNRFFGRVPGGLGVSTVGASSLFAAVSGSAMASASTMATVAVPEMRKYGYDPGYSAACAAVGGTLGALIPPSAVLVLYGVLTEESIGSVLIAGIIPGFMTTLVLMLTAGIIGVFRPSLAPRRSANGSSMSRLSAVALAWPVPVIFGVSMGGIYAGVFTATEAGAVGAFMAIIYAAATRRLSFADLSTSLSSTVRITAMIFLIVIGGISFGFFISLSRIPAALLRFVTTVDLAPALIVALIFVVYFLLGVIMEELAILVIMTPIMYPVIIGLGYDGIWFGILTTMMLLTGLLTPPIGLIVFVVSGVSGVRLGPIFRRVVPFWVALIVCIAVVIVLPEVVTFLPDVMR